MLILFILSLVSLVLVNPLPTFPSDFGTQEIADASTPGAALNDPDSSDGSATTSNPITPDVFLSSLEGDSEVFSAPLAETSSASRDPASPIEQSSTPIDPQFAANPPCVTDETTGSGNALPENSGAQEGVLREREYQSSPVFIAESSKAACPVRHHFLLEEPQTPNSAIKTDQQSDLHPWSIIEDPELFPIKSDWNLCPPDLLIYRYQRNMLICDSGRPDQRTKNNDGTYKLVNALPFNIRTGCWFPRRRWCCEDVEEDEERKKAGIFWMTADNCVEVMADHNNQEAPPIEHLP